MIDLTELSDEQLDELADDVSTELSARRAKAQRPQALDAMLTAELEDAGVQKGDPWVQPRHAGDAYPLGWEVTHEDQRWESTVAGNVWPPGQSSWHLVSEDGAPAEWVRPSGAHDSYRAGDLVTFKGTVYRSKIDNNVWSPTEHAAGWEQVND